MARPIPFIFCRYQLLVDGRSLAPEEQLDLLQGIKGHAVVHKKAQPTEADFDTFLMMPTGIIVDGHRVLTWRVAHRRPFRHKADYDHETDKLRFSFVEDRSVRYETFVALVDRGAVAVSDRTGDLHLGAQQAISRFETIVRKSVRGGVADVSLLATASDINRALEEWSLSEFAFSVRPFNPSVRDQGRKLHDALEEEGIGTLRGVARPMPGQRMHMEEGGFIYDAVGLANAGYGQFGVKGETPGGRAAQIKKPEFSLERRKNEATQAKAKILRVFIEPQMGDQLEVEEAARALIDFYGQD